MFFKSEKFLVQDLGIRVFCYVFLWKRVRDVYSYITEECGFWRDSQGGCLVIGGNGYILVICRIWNLQEMIFFFVGVKVFQ